MGCPFKKVSQEAPATLKGGRGAGETSEGSCDYCFPAPLQRLLDLLTAATVGGIFLHPPPPSLLFFKAEEEGAGRRKAPTLGVAGKSLSLLLQEQNKPWPGAQPQDARPRGGGLAAISPLLARCLGQVSPLPHLRKATEA